MATTLTENTFSSTYKDDFRDSNGYHRILFNSGVGLQARELTQLQTILQNQISRLGDNVFKEGAVVKPGGVNINPKYEFIRLDESLNANKLSNLSASVLGRTITGASSTIEAEVLEVVTADNTVTPNEPATLYVKYIKTDGAQSASDTVTVRMSGGETLNISGIAETLKVGPASVTTPPVGVGTQVTILGGIYYARNNFVFTENQTKIISKYNDIPTTDIGFKSVEDVITASDDNSLYDNQGSVPNLTAPGADRYRIRLTIAERSELTASENFIHVASIRKGRIYSAIDTYSAYNIPNDVVAKRIFENSGDYIVKPFKINFEPDSENTHLLLKVSDGVVVVDGYRAARTFPTTIRVAKPTATLFDSSEATGIEFGNHVINDPTENGNGGGTSKGLPNINTFEKLNLRTQDSHGGSTIGSARVKAVSRTGSELKFHLMDIQLNSGNSFRDVKSIGTSTSNYFDLKLENSKGILKQANKNTSLFKVPFGRPQTISNIVYTAQRRQSGLSANSSGVVQLDPLTNPGEAFTDQNDWIFAPADSAISRLTPTIAFTNTNQVAGTADFGVSSGFNGQSNIELLSYVQKGQASIRQKVLNTTTVSNAVESDGSLNNFSFINLEKPDIFDIQSAVLASDSNISVLNRFSLDNGQRDDHYGLGRLVLNGGQSAPSGNVSITFRHFTSPGSGDFFAANSYTGQIEYSQIPNFRRANGNLINLRDYLDFRPVVGTKGSFDSGGPILIEQPKPGSVVNSDITYNLAQSAKLVIGRSGLITLVPGPAAFNPTPPNKIDQTLPLYDIVFGAATLNESDLSISKIDHKRFTMKDIGRLEKRVDKVEEMAALSLLEIDTKFFQVLDSAGNDRTKSGFIVDNFVNAVGADFAAKLGEQRYALDPQEHVIRPACIEENIRLIYDSAASAAANGGTSKTVKRGDNVYIAYDDQEYISQTTASDAIKINPFSVTIYDGTLTLSPQSDEWRDVDRRPKKIVNTGKTKLSAVNAFNWNNWSWNWGGVPIDELTVGSQTNSNHDIVNRIVSEETILELVEDRVIETKDIPFMRSKKVFFKAEGLRPNSLYFPFLDGVNISAFTKGQTGPSGFQRYSDDATDFGNTLTGLTEHPDGQNALVSDGNGVVSGSFIVPNNDALKIQSGTKQFKIMDISVDDEKNAAAVAKAPYASLGFIEVREGEYNATRQLNVQGVDVYGLTGGGGRNIYDNDGGPDITGGTIIADRNLTLESILSGRRNSWSTKNNYRKDLGYNTNDDGVPDNPESTSGGTGETTGDHGEQCVVATHGLSTGAFTLLERHKAIVWCTNKYHGSWYGEAFRRGYRNWGTKLLNVGKHKKAYKEFKDFIAYGRGLKKDLKAAYNYYYKTITFFLTGLFLK